MFINDEKKRRVFRLQADISVNVYVSRILNSVDIRINK